MSAVVSIGMSVQEYRENYVSGLILLSATALPLYSILLQLPEEIKYIWHTKFTLPVILYIISRYFTLATEGISFFLNTAFKSPSRACGALTNLGSCTYVLHYTGTQGLLIARAYALCEGNTLIVVALAFGFFLGLFFPILKFILFRGCIVTRSVRQIQLTLIGNLCGLLTDFLVFGVCVNRVWSTWKLKRRAGIQGQNDLVSILLKQIVTRFCFAIVMKIGFTIGDQFTHNPTLAVGLSSMVQSLSSILVTSFILNLRQYNSKVIEANSVSLSVSLSIIHFVSVHNVLRHVNRSLIIEMGDEDENDNAWELSTRVNVVEGEA